MNEKRVRGWVLLFCGGFLTILMAVITVSVGPGLLSPGVRMSDGSTFTGTAEQGMMALGLFAILILFGLVAAGIGLRWITNRSYDKRLVYGAIGLFVALWAVMLMLRGTGL
jgi:hypothetical protein